MKDILNLVQTTLDTLLVGETDNVYSYWGRRAENADANANEYIVYELNSDNADVSADGQLFYRRSIVSLQYYVNYRIARTYQGRQNAMDRMDAIREAMRSVGFGCPGGWFEIGDVDDVGFATFRSEYEIPRLMDGE